MSSPSVTTVLLPPAKGSSIGGDGVGPPRGKCPPGSAATTKLGKIRGPQMGRIQRPLTDRCGTVADDSGAASRRQRPPADPGRQQRQQAPPKRRSADWTSAPRPQRSARTLAGRLRQSQFDQPPDRLRHVRIAIVDFLRPSGRNDNVQPLDVVVQFYAAASAAGALLSPCIDSKVLFSVGVA
jgi:hypothetical protein